MIEIENFYNQGFGWVCRNCDRVAQAEDEVSDSKLSRIMREGEAESKQPRLSNSALARWVDKTQQALMCPRCGTVEQVDKG